MASHTLHPRVLLELFQALDNDPFVIAECLARPLVAERLGSELNVRADGRDGPLGRPLFSADDAARSAIAPYQTNYKLPRVSVPLDCTDDTWTATTTVNAPDARDRHTAVWTGSEMIIWGGSYTTNVWNYFNTGGRYDPATDSWTATSITNAPTARDAHAAVWTGSEMIVWGGGDNTDFFYTGGRYNPADDTWTATSTANVPLARVQHTAVWTGSEMIVWGGYGCGANCNLNSGGRYNPSTDSWTATSTINAPVARWYHSAVWTGSEMVVWGGTDNIPNHTYLNTGGRYNPDTDSWTATGVPNDVLGRVGHSTVWSGSEMIVWGGTDSTFNDCNTGGRYNPSTDSWVATSPANLLHVRDSHTAVWTGSEMIVWGGGFCYPCMDFNDGARYDPATDGWVPTSIANAPLARLDHTAVWTGSEMIVWGGYNIEANIYLNTGGRYCAQGGPSPTPTPTASPTPYTPTPTPTLTPCDSGVIVNGCFETGDFTGWVIDGNNPTPVVTNLYPHTGMYSAFAGGSNSPQTFCYVGNEPAGDSSFYQQFTVPAGYSTLTFWYLTCSTDTIQHDWQDAYITDINGTILQTLFHQCTDNGVWVQRTVPMVQYAGQTMRLKFLVHQDGIGDLTGLFVDDVRLLGPSATPSPTPTPTPTTTATPTLTPAPTATATATSTATPRPSPTPRSSPAPRSRPTPPPRP